MHTIPDNLLIFIDGKNKTSEIKRFDISKHNVRFVFSLNNKVYTYSRDRVKFKKNVLKSEKAQNIKQYFEKLSLNSPIKIEDSDTSILNNYFNKIECILEDEEVLSYYLEKKPLNIINIDENSLIFPFGINLSQQGAVRNAFLSRISIIQGPPGTGKTQTILNIIANAILNKKSIVIASNNNSAILNVQEKLKKYNLDFLVAVLGSKKNKENFVLSQTEYPEFSCSELSTKQIKDEIKKQKEKINSVLEQQNRLAKLETEYCNKQFYNDELLPMTQDSQDSDVLKVIQTVKGNHARGHINERQIEVIKQEVLPFLEKDYSIGVISPYRDQVTALQKVLAQAVEVDTIHKFQGREKDIIIFSTVDNDVSPFIDNPNLINVAVSRAVKKFWLVCSNNETDKNDQIQNLIKYIKYNNFEVTESKIHSIFDLLYKQYTKEREEFLAKHKKVSIYVSENLAYVCIKKCLSDIGVLTIDFVIHVPLLDFVKITDEFTDEEIRFIRTDAHVDFLIYNKMDKKPILAIEVDGFKYHKQNFKQINRDQIKNIILEKIGLPLLRLSTTGANEEERIKSKINEIIK